MVAVCNEREEMQRVGYVILALFSLKTQVLSVSQDFWLVLWF